ncbi:MAG: PAS domain S-box protein, partial [Pseudomonadota bacterium]
MTKIEKEIEGQLASGEATRADMAAALHNLEREIAERKRAEEELRESEEKFRSIAEQSPNMIFINQKGRVVYANRLCEEIMGYTREEFYSPAFDFLSIIAPESVELIRASFARHMQGREVEPYEYTLINKKGERIEAIITTRLMTFEGETAICGIVTDISERKRAETALRDSEKRYKILFESAGDGINVHDLDGKILDVNQMQCERLGYSREEYLALNLRDIIEIETADLIPERIKKAKEYGHIVMESVNIRKDGTRLPIETNSSFFEYKGKPALLAII